MNWKEVVIAYFKSLS